MNVRGVLVLPHTMLGMMTLHLAAGSRLPEPLDIMNVMHVVPRQSH